MITFPREAILSAAQLAAAIGVSAETVERMDLPFFRAGNKVRYVYSQVLDLLAERAASNGVPATISYPSRRKRGS